MSVHPWLSLPRSYILNNYSTITKPEIPTSTMHVHVFTMSFYRVCGFVLHRCNQDLLYLHSTRRISFMLSLYNLSPLNNILNPWQQFKTTILFSRFIIFHLENVLSVELCDFLSFFFSIQHNAIVIYPICSISLQSGIPWYG